MAVLMAVHMWLAVEVLHQHTVVVVVTGHTASVAADHTMAEHEAACAELCRVEAELGSGWLVVECRDACTSLDVHTVRQPVVVHMARLAYRLVQRLQGRHFLLHRLRQLARQIFLSAARLG